MTQPVASGSENASAAQNMAVPTATLATSALPLPLTAFELLMFRDNRPHAPMTFFIELQFRGTAHRAGLDHAIAATVERHPLLSAQVKSANGKWVWFHPSSARPSSQWVLPSENPRHLAGSYRDLRKETGFRAYLASESGKTRIWLQFHHAVCDGLGTRQVIADISSNYRDWCIASLPPSEVAPDIIAAAIPLPPLDYDRLGKRGEFPIAEPKAIAKTNTVPSMTIRDRFRTAWQFFKQAPWPVDGTPGSTPAPSDGIHHYLDHQLDLEQTSALVAAAGATGTQFNNVAVGLLLHVLADWTTRQGRRERHFRVLVPVDLRTREDRHLPAANRLSFVFITRDQALCGDRARVIETVDDEFNYIREHACGYNLVQILPSVVRIPGALSAVVNLPLCHSTAVLTNVGNPVGRLVRGFPRSGLHSVIGNLEMTQIIGFPPIRPKTNVGFCLCFYAGKLTISMIASRRAFSHQDAQTIFQSYLSAWTDLVKNPLKLNLPNRSTGGFGTELPATDAAE